MSNVSGPLQLKGEVSITKIFSARGNIDEGQYNQASVADSQPQSLWVIYNTVDWDHNHPMPNPGVNKVVRGGLDSMVTLDPSIRSAQGFDATNPGVILFEHSDFRGYGTKFDHGQQDITTQFPQDTTQGATSAITGGKWTFYKGYNYRQPLIINGETVLGPGEYLSLGLEAVLMILPSLCNTLDNHEPLPNYTYWE